MRKLTFSISIALIIITLNNISVFAQQSTEFTRYSLLRVETGLIADSYNSVGPRLKIEVQRIMSQRWIYGIAFDSKWHMGHYLTDQTVDLPPNSNTLSGSIYYCILPNTKVFSWQIGAGFGGTHLYWDDTNRWGLTITTNMTANIRISKNVYLVASPLIVLFPVSEFNYSFIKKDKSTGYSAVSVLPFGVKIKL
jgi:hypothetical protein